ncbi:MAG: DUF1499 domain-containing protein [Candidatus Hydrogenedentes bacterium]|nr:DUF1499 domain-containing protein [Candidatus Hydrogenedentota bacterium]
MISFVNKTATVLPALSLLLFAGGMLLAHWELLPPTTGMALYVLGGLLGLLSLGAAVGVIVVSRAWPLALFALLGVLPFVAVAAGAGALFRYPRINDVSTDLQHPPAFAHAPTLPANAGRSFDFPAGNAPLIAAAYPDVQPVEVPFDPDAAYARALRLARETPNWTVTHEDAAAHTFEAVAVTKLFRWRDDVVVRITGAGEHASRIDMRSKSRDGKSDFGANAKRIQGFLDHLRLP